MIESTTSSDSDDIVAKTLRELDSVINTTYNKNNLMDLHNAKKVEQIQKFWIEAKEKSEQLDNTERHLQSVQANIQENQRNFNKENEKKKLLLQHEISNLNTTVNMIDTELHRIDASKDFFTNLSQHFTSQLEEYENLKRQFKREEGNMNALIEQIQMSEKNNPCEFYIEQISKLKENIADLDSKCRDCKFLTLDLVEQASLCRAERLTLAKLQLDLQNQVSAKGSFWRVEKDTQLKEVIVRQQFKNKYMFKKDDLDELYKNLNRERVRHQNTIEHLSSTQKSIQNEIGALKDILECKRVELNDIKSDLCRLSTKSNYLKENRKTKETVSSAQLNNLKSEKMHVCQSKREEEQYLSSLIKKIDQYQKKICKTETKIKNAKHLGKKIKYENANINTYTGRFVCGEDDEEMCIEERFGRLDELYHKIAAEKILQNKLDRIERINYPDRLPRHPIIDIFKLKVKEKLKEIEFLRSEISRVIEKKSRLLSEQSRLEESTRTAINTAEHIIKRCNEEKKDKRPTFQEELVRTRMLHYLEYLQFKVKNKEDNINARQEFIKKKNEDVSDIINNIGHKNFDNEGYLVYHDRIEKFLKARPSKEIVDSLVSLTSLVEDELSNWKSSHKDISVQLCDWVDALMRVTPAIY